MEIEQKHLTLPQIKARESNIDLEPGFQRGKVWSLEQKQKFLDSLAKGWPTPKIVLRLTDEKNEIYQCIDGQQRLRTVFSFLNDSIPLSKEFSEVAESATFSKLHASIKDKFMLYVLDVDIVKDKNDDVIGEFFLRLNQGIAVNSSEKLKSIGGNMKDFVWNLSKNEFLESKTAVKNTRDSFISICAQTCFLEMRGIQNLKFKDLEKMFKANKNFDDRSKEAVKIKKVYQKLDEIFNATTPEIKNRAGIISLYLLVSKLLDRKALEGNETKVKEFFIDFQRKLDTEKEKDSELMVYQNSVIQAQDSKTSIQKRNEILIRRLCLFDKSFQPYFSEVKLSKVDSTIAPDKKKLIIGIMESMNNINKKMRLFEQDNLRVARLHDSCEDIKAYNFLVQELNKWIDNINTSSIEVNIPAEELKDDKGNKKKAIQLLEIYIRTKGMEPSVVCENMRNINLLAKSIARHGGTELERRKDLLLDSIGINHKKIDFELLWEKTLTMFYKSLQEIEKII